MYHILAPQRQAQFGAGQAFDHHAASIPRGGRRRTVCACRRRRRQRLRSAPSAGCGPSSARSTLSKPSTSAPERRAIPRSPSMRATRAFSGASARSAWPSHCALAARAEEFLLHRLGDGLARGLHPQAPARQLRRHIGHHLPSGAATKRIRRCSGKTSPDTMSAPFARIRARPSELRARRVPSLPSCAPRRSSGFGRLLAFAAFFSRLLLPPALRSSRS